MRSLRINRATTCSFITMLPRFKQVVSMTRQANKDEPCIVHIRGTTSFEDNTWYNSNPRAGPAFNTASTGQTPILREGCHKHLESNLDTADSESHFGSTHILAADGFDQRLVIMRATAGEHTEPIIHCNTAQPFIRPV